MQCQVLFWKTSSIPLLFLDAVCSSQANQVFQAWLLWAEETPFNPFHTAAENWTCLMSISLHFPYACLDLQLPFQTQFFLISREKWYAMLSFFPLVLLKTNDFKCHLAAFGMHILAFSVVQSGKSKFVIELVTLWVCSTGARLPLSLLIFCLFCLFH